MKLTVGIPTYNRSRLLKETLESVLHQAFTDFTVIVSDNASTDDTADVVRSFADERVRYSRNPQNIGPIANLNRLIGLADTEYLLLLPDDDILYPGHLDAAIKVLDGNPSAGLVHTAFDFIDENSAVVNTVNPLQVGRRASVDSSEAALEYMMTSPWGLCFSTVVYRTQAIAAAGGLRAEEEPFGDRQLWMRIALDWDYAYVDEPLVGFRTHADSITRNIAPDSGISNTRELVLHYSRITYRGRMDFLAGAPLRAARKRRLGSLATLSLLAESAWHEPWRQIARQIAVLARDYPPITLRAGFWRLVAAQMGGRRARSALRRVSALRVRTAHG